MNYKFSDLTIHKLFATRADLYLTVYMHPKVKVGMERIILQSNLLFVVLIIPLSLAKVLTNPPIFYFWLELVISE